MDGMATQFIPVAQSIGGELILRGILYGSDIYCILISMVDALEGVGTKICCLGSYGILVSMG